MVGWKMVIRRGMKWTVDSGQWTVDSGQDEVDSGQWTGMVDLPLANLR